MVHLRGYLPGFLALLILASQPAHSQASLAYPNTAEGLQQCLTDILATAKSGNRDKLAALLKDMEIPNFPAWFNKTYGREKGKDSAESYRMNVDYDEFKFADLLTQFAQQDGQVLTRKVNGSPQPGNELEGNLLQSMRKPVDIYFASWQAAGRPAPPQGAPIGYFMFIDGKFRWDNAAHARP